MAKLKIIVNPEFPILNSFANKISKLADADVFTLTGYKASDRNTIGEFEKSGSSTGITKSIALIDGINSGESFSWCSLTLNPAEVVLMREKCLNLTEKQSEDFYTKLGLVTVYGDYQTFRRRNYRRINSGTGKLGNLIKMIPALSNPKVLENVLKFKPESKEN